MASIAEQVGPRGTTYRVRWREDDRKCRSRSFPTPAAAAAFRLQVEETWPDRGRFKTPWSSMRERIEASVEVDSLNCWLWKRTIYPVTGYGKLTVQTPTGPVTKLAHRASYEAFVGPIPNGLVIDHLCRVRRCVSPKHLEAVTQQENVWRSPIHLAHSRSRGQCPQGHVLATVGVYKVRGYDVCRSCSLSRSAAYHTRKRAERTVGGVA